MGFNLSGSIFKRRTREIIWLNYEKDAPTRDILADELQKNIDLLWAQIMNYIHNRAVKVGVLVEGLFSY